MIGKLISIPNADTLLLASDRVAMRIVEVQTEVDSLAIYSQPNQGSATSHVPKTGGTIISGTWYVRMAYSATITYELINL